MLMMAVVVSLLTSSGDTPIVRVSPVGYKTAQDCAAWQQSMESVIAPTIDPISGRNLEGRLYQCLPIEGEKEISQIRAALSAVE